MKPKRKVLLIGWDAADWEHINPLLDQGLLPTLEGLINRGVMGNLATLQPVLSPMLWNSVATGKLADKHGIHGFIEPDPVHGGARPYTSTSRKVKALWNILRQSGLRSNVVGWWASHPAEPINKQDERIYGASLIDIAPTVLSLFDLPTATDMDGRPLLEAFEIAPKVETIASWEDVPGEAGMHPAGTEIDPIKRRS